MALLPAQGACSQGGRSGGCIGLVGDMVEAMTSTIIESEKRTGEIPVQPRNERSVSILERVAAARAQYKLRSTGIDIPIVEA